MKMMLGTKPIKALSIRNDSPERGMSAMTRQNGSANFASEQQWMESCQPFCLTASVTMETDHPIAVPDDMHLVAISSMRYPIQMCLSLRDSKKIDLSIPLEVAQVIVSRKKYPILAQEVDGFLTLSCSKSVLLNVFWQG